MLRLVCRMYFASTAPFYLPLIHNGVDVVMGTYCWFTATVCLTLEPGQLSTSSNKDYLAACRNDTYDSGDVDFTTIMTQSVFSIVLPGEGSHSYRLLEALGVRGCRGMYRSDDVGSRVVKVSLHSPASGAVTTNRCAHL